MAQYYQDWSIAPLQQANTENCADAAVDAPVLSEFDKLRETLLTNDAEEGWASKLCQYLGTMQRDVSKDTDLIE